MTINSELASQHLETGDRLQQSDKFEEAIALNKLAEVYYAQQKYVEAIAQCYQTLRHQPDFAAAYKTLGNILQAQGKTDAAIRAYSKAIEFDPNFV